MMFNFKKYIFLVYTISLFLNSCSMAKIITDSVDPLLESIDKSINKSNDVEMVREALPANLLILDGLLEASPDNKKILLATIQAYFLYSFAFVEETDKERAKKLYLKAKKYALRMLVVKKKFLRALELPQYEPFLETLSSLTKKEVPALFWLINTWMAWINLSLDNLDIFIDIPKIESILLRILELDETYFYGGPHLSLAGFYGVLPESLGGQPNKAKEHFVKAFAFSKGKLLLVYLFYAKYYAVQIQDRKLFLESLETILAAPPDLFPERNLLNEVVRFKAQKLLEKVDDFF